jgi:hypothetical protein
MLSEKNTIQSKAKSLFTKKRKKTLVYLANNGKERKLRLSTSGVERYAERALAGVGWRVQSLTLLISMRSTIGATIGASPGLHHALPIALMLARRV